jgi:DNA-binding NtrC family response regulator
MTKLYRILVAEDHPETREAWTELIASWGFTVEVAEDGKKAIELIDSFQPHVLLLDLKMPFKDGLEVLGEIHEKGLPITTIVISGEGDIPEAVQAAKNGAYDYLRKPIEPERLHIMLNNLCNHMSLDQENRRLRMHLMNAGRMGQLIGHSQAMRRVMALVEQAAPAAASVILCGESGTGKEVVARTIHEMSGRRKGAYVAVNCAALPEALLECELFGHERGAFTGADQRREGCFELAQEGTLLLDEIGEMKPELQAKLLRVLEERKLRRLGGTADITLDVRVLAATNRSLSDAIRDGRLREDLYYRLNVITIDLPRLSERVEDIPLLAETFIREFAKANGKNLGGADAQCIEALRSRKWPGNVRELRNVIERAVILSSGPLLTVSDVCPTRPNFSAGQPRSVSSIAGLPVGKALKEVERDLILQTLDMVKGNRLRAAEILGISPKTLYNKLGRYHFKEEKSQTPPSIDPARYRE